jgi:prevent-host-death family protein
MRSLKASEFKARCLAILEEVDRTGEPVMITKRGRPVARLVPPVASAARHPQDTLAGTVEVVGDIVGPAVPATAWHALRARKRRK